MAKRKGGRGGIFVLIGRGIVWALRSIARLIGGR